MEHLASALPACPALAIVNMASNGIGAAGARALAGALPRCESMWYLSVSDNAVGDEGAAALVAALALCPPSVEHLDLQCNNVNVARALPRAPNLGCQVYL
jgi:Ran GTPase-activating protein (RanGAP) involved in mRNA processing and transport